MFPPLPGSQEKEKAIYPQFCVIMKSSPKIFKLKNQNFWDN